MTAPLSISAILLPRPPDIDKYIISTAAGYERPLCPRDIGTAAQSNYFEGRNDDGRREDKRMVMSTTSADIEKMAALISALAENGRCAVVGSRDKIDEAGDIFAVKEDI